MWLVLCHLQLKNCSPLDDGTKGLQRVYSAPVFEIAVMCFSLVSGASKLVRSIHLHQMNSVHGSFLERRTKPLLGKN